MFKTAQTIAEVVTNGLCIGCGLCEAVAAGRVKMVAKQSGSIRPSPVNDFKPDEEALLLIVCPGVKVEPRFQNMPNNTPVWGNYSSLSYAWAGDPDTLSFVDSPRLVRKYFSKILHLPLPLEC